MDAPADLRPSLFKADSPGETTYFIILNAAGRVHSVIPGGTMRDGRASEATAYVKEQFEKVAGELELPAADVTLRDVRLPDVEPASERRAALRRWECDSSCDSRTTSAPRIASRS